ncbi:MAG: DUF378 domain-containing protein [Patescibacteria group bacterium]
MNQKQLVGWVLAISAILWGLYAFGFMIDSIVGAGLAKIVYVVVGLVGLYKVYLLTMSKK